MAKKKVNISRGKGAQRAFFTFAEDMELQYGPNIKEIAEAYSKDLVENTTKARKVLDKNMTGILVNVMSYLGRLRFFLNKFQLFLGKGFDVEAGRLPELRTALRNAGRALSESDKAIDHREVNVALVCLVVIFKYLEFSFQNNVYVYLFLTV